MTDFKAIPGVNLPIPIFNSLLNAEERFLVDGQTYLLQPKTITCLNALLGLLKKEKIPYRLMKRKELFAKEEWILSLQNLNRIELIGDSVLSVETGCQVEILRHFLYKRGVEIGLPSESVAGLTIGELIYLYPQSGLKIRQLDLQDRLLALEAVENGQLLKWGQPLTGVKTGPALQHTFREIRNTIAGLVKLVFRVDPVPEKRLFLRFPFDNWQTFDELEDFTSTWERLDCLIPEKKSEKGYVLGQISGLQEEMDAFMLSCPGEFHLMKEDQVNLFKAYFKQQNADYRNCNRECLKDFCDADYYWYHGLIKTGYLIYLNKNLPQKRLYEAPQWEKRFMNAL